MNKKIAVINDISGFGRCSLTAALPVISALGLQPCPLVTAVLSAQTGFPDYCITDLTDHMDAVADKWQAMGADFDGIYVGFLTGADQINSVRRFLSHFRRPGSIFLIDPILGDNGTMFPIFEKEYAKCLRELVSSADITTPNLTELCLLTGTDYSALAAAEGTEDYYKKIAEAAMMLIDSGTGAVTVTGIYDGDKIANLAVDKNGFSVYKSGYRSGSFSGTGDLFASVICGCLVKGISLNKAVELAANFISAAISATPDEDKNYGIAFESVLGMLTDSPIFWECP